ncbi:septation protein SepH, partial [Thermocatellispora tengchongensis]
MQELRLVAVSEDGTYLVLATAGRGTRFTLPVDDRLRAAVRGNFSRLGQYEIEVESPLRPKEIQARIRAGETAEEIAATAGIPVERVRWFEGPVLQEREYMAQQAQRVAVRLPGESSPGPTLGELVAERLTRRGVPADEIDWDSCKRDDGMWRIKLGFVWNGHTRHAEWLFDPRRRHISPHDDEAMRLSASDYVDPPAPSTPDTTVTPFVPRVAKLQPVPPLAPEPLMQPPVHFPSVVRHDPPAPAEAPARPETAALSRFEPPALPRAEPNLPRPEPRPAPEEPRQKPPVQEQITVEEPSAPEATIQEATVREPSDAREATVQEATVREERAREAVRPSAAAEPAAPARPQAAPAPPPEPVVTDPAPSQEPATPAEAPKPAPEQPAPAAPVAEEPAAPTAPPPATVTAPPAEPVAPPAEPAT